MSDNNNAVRQELRENNPFISSVSPQPFENTTPDLMQLNRTAYEEIEQLILIKRRQPSLPLAGLIIGEPGCGKTHMLTRMLRNLRKHAKLAIFVTVKTFIDPESVTYDLLSEILISLSQIHSYGRSQFDMLVNEVLESYKEHRLNDGFTDTSKLEIKTYLAHDLKGINKNVLKCLLLYAGTTDKSVKWSILDWLRDGLDEEDSLNLGLPVRDVNSMSIATRENEAQKILLSLGLLLSYAHVPMIICFDQLDYMKSQELISAWGNVINLLMNDLSGVLPLCFIKFQTWNEIIKPKSDPSVVQRLKNNTIIMKECSLAQAKLLIHDRIAEAFKNNNPEEKYNWLISRLDKKLKPGLSPRLVIELANKEIQEAGNNPDKIDTPPQYDLVPRTIMNAYNEECLKVKKEPLSWPPNAEQLAVALEAWLDSQEGFEVKRYAGKKHLKIRAKYKGKEFDFFIVTPKVHTSAANALKQGIDIMSSTPGTECFYISESKSHKKSWRKTNEVLQDFTNNGGHAYILDKDERVNWYGLFSLITRIDNGDVDLLLASGNRTATREDASEFLSGLNLIDVNFSGKSDSQAKSQTQTSKRRQKSVNSDTLGRSLLDIINDSPMKLISLKKAIESLSDMNIQISEQELAAFLKANTAVFKIFNAKNNNEDVLIGLSNRE